MGCRLGQRNKVQNMTLSPSPEKWECLTFKFLLPPGTSVQWWTLSIQFWLKQCNIYFKITCNVSGLVADAFKGAHVKCPETKTSGYITSRGKSSGRTKCQEGQTSRGTIRPGWQNVPETKLPWGQHARRKNVRGDKTSGGTKGLGTKIPFGLDFNVYSRSFFKSLFILKKYFVRG